MNHRRTYAIGASTLIVQFGDILDSDAEVLVSSDDYLLSMGGGVSAAIASAAGSSIALDAAKAVPRSLGDVVVTTAGALDARYVFHVVTIGNRFEQQPDDSADTLVADACRRCLDLVERLGVQSIAFPAIGGGVAGLPVDHVAAGMARAIVGWLHQSAQPIRVELYLRAKRWQSDDEYIVFFERLAQQVVLPPTDTATARETLAVDVNEELVQLRDKLLDLERQRAQLEAEIARGRNEMSTGHDGRAADEIGRVTKEMVDVLAERQPVRVFVSYSHDDEELKQQLVEHMAPLSLNGLVTWDDRRIPPGAEWQDQIHHAIEQADLALFLISPSFLASPYCIGTEWNMAQTRQQLGVLTIVPIILRPSMWEDVIGNLQALPRDGRPISTHANQDEAFLEVAVRLRDQVKDIRARRITSNQAG